MKIDIQAIHFDLDAELGELIEARCLQFEKLSNDINSIEVYLKLEGNGPVRNKLVEINNLHNSLIFNKRLPEWVQEPLL